MTDIMTWLAQCGIVALVLTLAAWTWETSARWSGRAVRWAWLSALGGTIALPFVLRAIPSQTWSEAIPAVGVMRLEALSIAAPAVTPARSFGAAEWGVALWLALSAVVIAYAALLLVRLAVARRRWRATEVDGAAVLVSRNLGPAAVGVRHAMVVLPAWALQLDAEMRRLMLLHEGEHVRAGDPRLLLTGLFLLAVMPWNPFVWLQLLRLRNAIELDCDARVLRRGVDPREYGSLLLEIGRRRGSNPLVLATFAEPRVFLEARIRRIARWPLPRRPLRAALLSVCALALFSTALVARVDTVSSAINGESNVLEALTRPVINAIEIPPFPLPVDTPPPMPALRPDPRVTPYTKAPALQNSAEIIARMTQLFPARLRERNVTGRVAVWVLVDETGRVRQQQLSRSSGEAALDSVGLRIAGAMQFEPALLDRRRVEAWIEVPITFGDVAHSVVVNEQPVKLASAASEGPTFTPMTVRPELRNAAEIQRAMIENYPPVLRDAGIGGTAVLWFYIDESGQVLKTQLHTSSGYPALDEAAARVASRMVFSPAKNRDKIVPVWVEIPMLFTSRRPDPQPSENASREVAPLIERAGSGAGGRITRERPVHVLPELTNARAVQAAIARNYPPLLRDAGITGTTLLAIVVGADGVPRESRIVGSSGHRALDEAALRVADEMRFSAARMNGTGVSSTVELPIAFGEALAQPTQQQVTAIELEPLTTELPKQPANAANNEGANERARTRAADPSTVMDTRGQSFTPVTKRAELINAREVQQALLRAYPPALRDAGIGGTVVAWMFIDENGEVTRTQLHTSSGFAELDRAALGLAVTMRFRPALNRERPVGAWTEIPILFTAK